MLKQSAHESALSTDKLNDTAQFMFRQAGSSATSLRQLVSGVKLARVVSQVLFDGANSVLDHQIITQNEDRKGNNVINMNMILKQVRSNHKVQCPSFIQSLTAFKLIDNQEEMMKFVNWLTECSQKHSLRPNINEQSKQNIQKNIDSYHEQSGSIIKNKRDNYLKKAVLRQNQQTQQYLYSKDNENGEQEQMNVFENVYFLDRDASPVKDNDTPINDSLDGSDSISKKGSFKVFKPKTFFENNTQENALNSNKAGFDQNNKPKVAKQENQLQVQQYDQNENQVDRRKTVNKFSNRPPLYRKLNKQSNPAQGRQQNWDKPLVTKQQHVKTVNIKKGEENQIKKIQIQEINIRVKDQPSIPQKNLIDDISRIEEEIKKESQQESKQIKTRNSRTSNNSQQKSNRKIFKIDIKQVEQTQRKKIIEWLISINLLNSMATEYYDRFHEICKNGVIFPEIVNHQKGRWSQLSYFKNPVKSAEVYSNYQKVFAYLKQLPNFESEILFQYDYFVPQAIESAFWDLLKSCRQCFEKGSKSQHYSFNRQSLIKQKLESKTGSVLNSRVKTEKNEVSSQSIKKNDHLNSKQYEKIRYGSTKKTKKQKSNTDYQHTPKAFSVEKQNLTKRKSSLDFIRELPEQLNDMKHKQLVQIDQPKESKGITNGYRQLYELKKSSTCSKYLQTPEKKQETSINKSRIVATNSNKKSQEKPSRPSISLQMEMKAVKYLKQKNYFNLPVGQSLSLFEDPLRNGVLLNKMVMDQLKVRYRIIEKPKNIVDCRQNFAQVFQQIKQSFMVIPTAYEVYVQEIIKGELTIFYGLVANILNAAMLKNSVGLNTKSHNALISLSKSNFEETETETLLQQLIFWIRQLEQQSSAISQSKIRDFNSLCHSILNQNFLYKIAAILSPQKYTLKPTYDHPANQIEQQSNIKKILSFYCHNKILKPDAVWKSKQFVKKDRTTIVNVMKTLMQYFKGIRKPLLNISLQNPVVSFVKYARTNSADQNWNSDRNDMLDTTTVNNNSMVNGHVKREVSKENKPDNTGIEVAWMRSLGFTQDLAINNGIILCRLMAKLTMQTLNFNENPTSKAECLTNVRKAIKNIEKFKWDQEEIVEADKKVTLEVYKFIREKYKHSYAFKHLA